MSKGCFITGTDTGVGKTVVTATLAVALRERGLRVGVMKPVETGCPEEGGRLRPQDALFLREISGCNVPEEWVVPYTLREPLAPALAAEMEGVEIEVGRIRECYERLLEEHDVVLVEGAGGLLVPVTEEVTMLDLAVELGVPVLVVARNVLGVINHTALTVTVARERSRVVGVVLNQVQAADPLDRSIESNAQALRRWGRSPLLGQIEYRGELTRERLGEMGRGLDVERVLEGIEG